MTIDPKKKWLLMFCSVVSGFILLIAMVLYRMTHSPDESSDSEQVFTEVPDGDVSEVQASKSDAYLSSSAAAIEAYWDDCEDELIEETVREEEDVHMKEMANEDVGVRQVTREELFGSYDSKTSSPKSSGGINPYRENGTERAERHQRRKEEAIELAEHFSDPQARQSEEPVQERIAVGSAPGMKGDGIISSLDDIDSAENPLGNPAVQVQDPVKCMFTRDEKLKNGQRVAVRTLQDLHAGEVIIPRNTHLMATVSLGARLTLEVSSVEMNGHIYSLGYEAYDSDGSRGLYCPEKGTARETVRNSGLGIVGSAVGGRVGRIAGQVVQSGISFAQSSGGERTVSVPSGYTFFLVSKNQNQ